MIQENNEIEIKSEEKPKVISKYMEDSKYGLRYKESWQHVVKMKKIFD
jgi:hypothetical protein